MFAPMRERTMKTSRGKPETREEHLKLPILPSSPALSRRGLLGWSAGLALSAPLAAEIAKPASAFAAGAQAQPVRGGTLIMVLAGDPPTVNPGITTGVPDVAVGSLVYEGLTRLDRNFTPQPNLAESWTISPDNLRYTFKLVKAKWQDGNDFAAKDVAFSLTEVSAKYGAKFRAAAEHIKSITTPDEHTVVIDLKGPFGPFLFSLSLYATAAILPEHVFAGSDVLTNPATLAKPVGTGPFMLKEWVRGDHLTLERNPNYWRSGRPYLDRIILKEIPDPDTRVLALKAGEVDYIDFYYFPVSHYREVARDKKLQTREGGIPEDHLIILNVRRKPFDNPKVRQALFTALDREYIKKVVYAGLGDVAKSAIDTRLAWAYNPDVDLGKMYPFSAEHAAAMLDAEGLKAGAGGKRFDLHLVYDSTAEGNDRLSQVVQSMWGKIGVNVIFEGSPRNVELTQVYKDWNFDATLQAYTTSGDPALGISRLYVTSAIKKAPFVNCSGYSNPKVDQLFAAGANAADLKDRAAAYKAVQVILAQDLPVFPIWQTALIYAASAKLQGKWAWSTADSYWEDVWMTS